jgi:hypothetical protein
MSNAYSEYVPTWERPVITDLCKALLGRGYYLAVHNGVEYESKRTNKWHSLRPHFGSTGEDALVVWEPQEDGSRKRLGSFYLIYNNGSEGDPMIVISDYGWTDDEAGEVFDAIWKDLSRKHEETA